MEKWIITNRRIVDDRIDESGDEPATPLFRIAKCGKTFSDYALWDEVEGDPLPSTKMMYSVHAALMRGQNAGVYVHGFDNDASKSFDNAELVFKNYPHDVQILISWSSVGKKLGTYQDDADDAETTGANLFRVWRKLVRFLNQVEPCDGQINLFCHSMGNQVLEAFMNAITPRYQVQLLQNVFMLHADVDWDVFSKNENKPLRDINKIAIDTYVVINRKDRVTGVISRYTKNFKRRLANGVEKPSELPQGVYVLDTTEMETETFKDESLNHWTSFYSPTAIEEINRFL